MGAAQGRKTLARRTSGTDVLTVQSGELLLVLRLCGTAKRMRREGSGTGTGTRVSPRLTFLLFLLGEERYRQPRAVYKYWVGDLPSCDHAATCFSSSSSFMAGMDQKGRCSGTYKSGIVGHYAPRAVFSSLVGRPRVLGRYGPEGQLPEAYRLLRFLGDDFCGLLHSALSLVRQRIHAVRQSTRLLENFGVVQTVQKTVKVPHAFLDMAVDKCRMVETVQILWSLRSWCCPPLSLLMAVSAAAMVSQRPWTTSNSGDGDLAASSFSVSCVLGSVAQGFEP